MPVLKLRRGTTAQNNAFTGQAGEVLVDLEQKTLRVHDGTTQGGTALAKKSEVDAAQATANAAQTAAANANNNANARLPISGGTLQGALALPKVDVRTGTPTGADYMDFRTATGLPQWNLSMSANREFCLNAYDDAGNWVSTPMVINRSGQMYMAGYGWLHDRFANANHGHSYNLSLSVSGDGRNQNRLSVSGLNIHWDTNCNCNCNCRC